MKKKLELPATLLRCDCTPEERLSQSLRHSRCTGELEAAVDRFSAAVDRVERERALPVSSSS